MSSQTHPAIRPSPSFLRTLPTLRVSTPATDGDPIQQYCRDSGFDYQLELKHETSRARFWLITKCSGKGFTGWEEGAAVLESLEPNEHGDFDMLPYTETQLKRLQAIDYFQGVRRELEELCERPESRENEKRIAELRKEIQALMPPLSDS